MLEKKRRLLPAANSSAVWFSSIIVCRASYSKAFAGLAVPLLWLGYFQIFFPWPHEGLRCWHGWASLWCSILRKNENVSDKSARICRDGANRPFAGWAHRASIPLGMAFVNGSSSGVKMFQNICPVATSSQLSEVVVVGHSPTLLMRTPGNCTCFGQICSSLHFSGKTMWWTHNGVRHWCQKLEWLGILQLLHVFNESGKRKVFQKHAGWLHFVVAWFPVSLHSLCGFSFPTHCSPEQWPRIWVLKFKVQFKEPDSSFCPQGTPVFPEFFAIDIFSRFASTDVTIPKPVCYQAENKTNL